VLLGDLVREARRHVSELTGLSPETVTGLDHVDDRWVVSVELLELARIPNTMDVLGTFEVTLSDDGALLGFRRLGRHRRSAIDQGGM
jgi:Gas vesicle synthesis protein GvpO